MVKKKKTAKQIERHMKGVANHYRIEIVLLLNERSNMTLESMADFLGANIKTVSGHTKSMVNAGLLDKNYMGRTVEHSLSPYGKVFALFLKSFQKH